MTRYRALRLLGADPLTAGFVAWLNWMFNVPPNEIRFMTAIVEITDIERYVTERRTKEEGNAT